MYTGDIVQDRVSHAQSVRTITTPTHSLSFVTATDTWARNPFPPPSLASTLPA
jgi:hypothetical protein